MPVVNEVGLSEYTATKQFHFRKILAAHVRICQNVIRKSLYSGNWLSPQYKFIDLNAGPGIYGNNGAPEYGSPLIFMQEIKRVMLDYQAYFVDHNEETCQMLARHIGGKEKAKVIHADNEIFIANLIEFQQVNYCRKKSLGLVYTDPTGKIPPFDALSRLGSIASFERVDFLIHIAATNVKRIRNSDLTIEGRTLKQLLSAIPKSEWLIRKPYTPFQWTFLLGTNWSQIKEFRNIDFVKLETPEGQAILEKVNLTGEEREANGNGHV